VDYRTLGASGCAVSSFCLGTMTFGSETDEPGAHRQLDRFVESGGTFVDTADVYSNGVSEQIIGRWLADRPAALTEPVVLATKGRFGPDGSANGVGLSARHLIRALDASLRRLGVDAVDLYQLHAFDPLTPLEETLRTLDGFIRAGKIRYWGLSNFTGWQLTKAVHLARALNMAAPVTLQPQYSLIVRGCCPGARWAAAGYRASTSVASALPVPPAWAKTPAGAWRPTIGAARRAPGRSSTPCRRWPKTAG
jgi:aryl-alcohol dehydrogenase-like predicted oxidoreductase